MAGKSYKLTGNTFAAKDDIKALGGKWDAASKTWTVEVVGTMKERATLDRAVYALRSRGISASPY